MKKTFLEWVKESKRQKMEKDFDRIQAIYNQRRFKPFVPHPNPFESLLLSNFR